MARKTNFIVLSNAVIRVDIGNGKSRFLAPQSTALLPITGEVIFLERQGLIKQLPIKPADTVISEKKEIKVKEEKIQVKKKYIKKKKKTTRQIKSDVKDGDK